MKCIRSKEPKRYIQSQNKIIDTETKEEYTVLEAILKIQEELKEINQLIK